MKNKFTIFLVLISFILLLSCQANDNNKPLPYYGEETVVDGDTILYTIPEFTFLSQDSIEISNTNLDDYIYLSDFFFISCPTICPVVKKQMLRIYDKYKDNPRVKLVSHTLDPKRDSPSELNRYAKKMNFRNDKWLFLTGDKDSLIDMAENYFVTAFEDEDAPGGINHSGLIVLVDTKKRVRASAVGTDPEDVTKLLKDIDRLLLEYEKN